MEERQLYPTRFCALEDRYAWGSETFNAADLGYRDSLVRDGWLAGNSFSEIMETYMDRLSGEWVFGIFGTQFPLCVRTLRVNGRMPLRVHPDDTTAFDRYDFLGKEKLWYVLDAGKDAALMLGWRRDTDAGEMLSAFEQGDKLTELLNIVHPAAGECYRIAPGTVHAASGELTIIEIAQASPLDFCMHSWGEEINPDEFDPALSGLDALDFVCYKAYNEALAPVEEGQGILKLLSIPQFEAKQIALKDTLRIRNGSDGGFALYTCVSGELRITADDYSLLVRRGETALVPAECEEYFLAPEANDTILLEASVPPSTIPDSYTGE